MTNKKARELFIVEDDLDDQYLINAAISELDEDICVTNYCDGQRAFADLLARQQSGKSQPDMVLLDLNMPGFNGFKFLEHRLAHEDLQCMPVLVYTTSNADSDAQHCYKLGANAYLIKPLRYADMKRLFEQTFNYWFKVVKLPANSPIV